MPFHLGLGVFDLEIIGIFKGEGLLAVVLIELKVKGEGVQNFLGPLQVMKMKEYGASREKGHHKGGPSLKILGKYKGFPFQGQQFPK